MDRLRAVSHLPIPSPRPFIDTVQLERLLQRPQVARSSQEPTPPSGPSPTTRVPSALSPSPATPCPSPRSTVPSPTTSRRSFSQSTIPLRTVSLTSTTPPLPIFTPLMVSPQHQPNPAIGSYDLLGLRQDICFDQLQPLRSLWSRLRTRGRWHWRGH